MSSTQFLQVPPRTFHAPRPQPPHRNNTPPRANLFHETNTEVLEATRIEIHEQRKASQRQRQRELAESLSAITAQEYEDDVLQQMLHMEAETMPDVNSIDIQQEVKWFMRPYLLDFLVEAHAAFQLLPDTLYLAVNILDRYCSKRVVYKKHYQLVGCAALLIASKYGDRKDRVPLIRELKSMCCSLYEEVMFTQMEWHVLVTLNWTVGHPTVDAFLQMVIADGEYDPELEHLTWYISEMALYHREFVSIMPSIIARSALTLARCILQRPIPNQDAADWASHYDSATVLALSEKLGEASEVLKKKFATAQLSCATGIVLDFVDRQQQQLAYEIPDPPTPVPAEMSQEIDDAMVDATITGPPVTPQKPTAQSSIPMVFDTPPITPETYGHAAHSEGDKHMAINQQHYLALPTPPSTGGYAMYNNAAYSNPSGHTQYF